MTHPKKKPQWTLFNSRKTRCSLYVFLQLATCFFSLQNKIKEHSAGGMTTNNVKKTLNEFAQIYKHDAGVAEE